MKTILSIIFICLSLSELCFAQGTSWAHFNNKFDSLGLQDLVNQAPAGNCRQPQYIEQVQAFLLTAVDYYQFIPAANGVFVQKQEIDSEGKPKQLELSSCFVEALFSAVMPDVLKVHAALKGDRKAVIRIFSTFMTERETSHDPQDMHAIRTTKLAMIAHSLLAVSSIRACDFSQDPLIFLSATYYLQSLIDIVYSGMGSFSFVRADACATKTYNQNPKNYYRFVSEKAIQLWGS
jgi:hypothetical protein